MENLKGERVLVTGASGFIGARLVETLSEREGAEVTALVRGRAPARFEALQNVRVVRCGYDSAATRASALQGQDVVINVAYDLEASSEELLRDFDDLVGACRKAGVSAFVQFSSIAVYDGWPGGDLSETSPADGPGSVYKTVKRAMETALAASGLPHIILQPTIVYGPFSPLWTTPLIEAFRAGDVILPDGPEGLCHAVFVDDVVDAAILAAARKTHDGERYIISGAEPVSWRAFYEAHARLAGAPGPRIEHIEAAPVRHEGGGGGKPKAARLASRFARNLLGARNIIAIRSFLQRLLSGGKKLERWPAPHEVELLRARGACHIESARAGLGYAPKVDFDEGMARIKLEMNL